MLQLRELLLILCHTFTFVIISNVAYCYVLAFVDSMVLLSEINKKLLAKFTICLY